MMDLIQADSPRRSPGSTVLDSRECGFLFLPFRSISGGRTISLSVQDGEL